MIGCGDHISIFLVKMHYNINSYFKHFFICYFLVVEYKIEEIGYIRYYLAPKIEDADE